MGKGDKDLVIGVEVKKKGKGAKEASAELKKLDRTLKVTATSMDRTAVRSAALSAKQKMLGKAVAQGKMSVEQASKQLAGFKKSLDDAAKGTEELTKKQTGSQKAMGFIKDNIGGIALGIGGVTGAVIAMKKVWEFGDEGAQIRQLEQSFDRLNETTFHTPGLMKDMQEATRGTVSEFNLMKGVMTLTAGASDDMAQKFAKASPELAEIAKAANKLNPTLGDTAFLYDSIALGIKRSSPLILDNLGIVVKIGKANEDYAAALGKTVEMLTAEEKQTALLNATIKSGRQLINQVGGDVDSLTDSYEQNKMEMETLKNEMKILVSRGIAPVVSGIASILTEARKTRELKEAEENVKEFAIGLAESGEILRGEAKGVNELEEATRKYVLQLQFERMELEGRQGIYIENAKTRARQLELMEFAIKLGREHTDATAEELLAMTLVQEATEARVDAATKYWQEYSDWLGIVHEDTSDVAGISLTLDETLKNLQFQVQSMSGMDAIKLQIQIDLAEIEIGKIIEARNELANQPLDIPTFEDNAAAKYRSPFLEWMGTGEWLDDIKDQYGDFGEDMVGTTEEVVSEWERAISVAEILDRTMVHLGEASGEYFDEAVKAPWIIQNTNDEFYNQAVAMGANAGLLAELGVATGQFTEAQARAALKTALVSQRIKELTADIIAGKDIDVALAELDSYIAYLDETVIPATEKDAERAHNAAIAHDEVLKSANIAHQEGVLPLLDELDNFPSEVETEVKVDTKNARQKLQALLDMIADITGIQLPNIIPGDKPKHQKPKQNPYSTDEDDYGAASGLSNFEVPPGYPNDSFKLGLTSGEVVDVDNGQGGRGVIFQGDQHTYYVPDQSTARFVAHQIDEAKRQRYEEFMGHG